MVRTWSNDLCKILAIGDIKYFDDLEIEWQELIHKSLSEISIWKLQGYDLTGLWSLELRSNIVKYMSRYYDLSLLTIPVEDQIIPSYGGTDSFVAILNTLKILARWKKINFIYPEASFIANVKIAEMILEKENCLIIKKPEPDDFFISLEQVRSLYKEGGLEIDQTNVFYITPVGNPTGNKIGNGNLSQTLQWIHEFDANAIFILDNVYVGLLPDSESHKLFQNIFADKSIMERIIFTESISKTLGTTGIRIGWTWTLNPLLSSELKRYTALTKAGFSKMLDEFSIHLLGNSSIFDFQNKVYEFWSLERMRFVEYMKHNFSELFDFDSSPAVSDREWIYVLLKIRWYLSKEEIFALTGIIGVGIELSDGNYIRYAFGNVKNF